MPDTVLIAGATGALGKHAVIAFKNAGFRVRALARPSARLEALRGVADEIRAADAVGSHGLVDACRGCRLVLSALGASVMPSRLTDRAGFSAIDWPAVAFASNRARRRITC